MTAEIAATGKLRADKAPGAKPKKRRSDRARAEARLGWMLAGPAFGLAPHAYLVQLRLARARRLLADGLSPAETAAALGFADQSHLGRWFRRAYGLTPAAYRARCSNLPDR